MKKLIITLSILSIILVGCGNGNTNSNENQNDNTTQIEETTIEKTSVDFDALVNEITSKVEWASLSTIDDENLINEFFKLDANNPNYKKILVKQCPMSAVIAEIILIQAEDVNSAIDDLQNRKQKLIDVDAYYPEHKEIAEKSIIGSYGDIAYFIASSNAEDSEKVLTEYLNNLK